VRGRPVAFLPVPLLAVPHPLGPDPDPAGVVGRGVPGAGQPDPLAAAPAPEPAAPVRVRVHVPGAHVAAAHRRLAIPFAIASLLGTSRPRCVLTTGRSASRAPRSAPIRDPTHMGSALEARREPRALLIAIGVRGRSLGLGGAADLRLARPGL